MSDDTPTDDQRAKFYLQQSIDSIGYYDTLKDGTDGMHGANSADQFIENLSRPFHEGVERIMQNKREHGHHPITAFEFAVRVEWPEWVKVILAESQHHVFTSGAFPESRSEEETEYVKYLERKYEVPR